MVSFNVDAIFRYSTVNACDSDRTTMAVERLAIFVLTARVFMDCAWGSFASANDVVAALHFDVIARAIVLALCMILLMKRPIRFSYFSLGLVFTGLAALVLSSVFALNSFLLVDLLVAVSVSFVHPRKLCRAYALALMLSLALVMIASFLGLAPMVDVIPNGRLVFGYGISHPNVLGGLLLSLACAQTYLFWESKQWRFAFGLSVAFAVFAKVSLSSNASALLMAAVGFINLIGHVLPRRISLEPISARVRSLVLIGIPVLLILVMLYLVMHHDSSGILADLADKATHARPLFASKYYEANGGFTLFGRPFVSAPSYHNGAGFAAVDSSYAYFALVFGLVPLAVCIAAYAFCIIRAKKKAIHPFVIAVIIVYAVFALIEGLPMHLYSNVTFLLLPCLARTASSDTEEC